MMSRTVESIFMVITILLGTFIVKMIKDYFGIKPLHDALDISSSIALGVIVYYLIWMVLNKTYYRFFKS